jgi:Mn-dependent DtxR family transcriptional regulator
MTYRLCLQNNYARVGKLSELLNVKPPSASKMISKLSELGYLKYDRYDIIQLTDLGRETGAYLLKRHETVEDFLRLIGNAEPLEETELIEHALSASTVEDLDDLLSFFHQNATVWDSFKDYKNSKNKV